MPRPVVAIALLIALASPALAEDGNSGVWTWKAEIEGNGKGFATALSPSTNVVDMNVPAYIVARCMSGRSEFMVGTSGGWATTGHTLEVTTQVDGKDPVTSRWDVSTNGHAAFLDSGVEDFLKTIPDAGKIRVEVKDPHGTAFENTFPTTGFGLVREKISQACGWKP